MKLRELFVEALNANQKKYVDDLIKKMEYNPAQWDHIFGKESRIYLPMSGTSEPNIEVVDVLAKLGYKIYDYIAGTAISTSPRQYTANVVFGRSPQIYQAWESDPHRTNPKVQPNEDVMNALTTMQYDVMDYNKGIFVKPPKPESIGKIFQANAVEPRIANIFEVEHTEDFNTSNQVIVITRDKYEVAEVSTNKKWNSCLNLGGGWTGLDTLGKRQGENSEPAIRDVSIGCIAAYLVKKNDMNLDDPVARVSMKPFISDTTHHIALGVHDKVYFRGASYPSEFREKVKEWADAVNASQELDGLFILHPEAYNFDEFEYQNKTQQHGNYESDKRTYDTYRSAIQKVPPELLTIGYLKMVLANDPTTYPTVVSRAPNAKTAIELTRTYIKNTHSGDISGYPLRFIDEAPHEYFDMVRELYNQTPGVINFLPEELYDNHRTELLKLYQFVLSRYNDGLRSKINKQSNIQEIYDILKFKVGPSTLRTIAKRLIRIAGRGDEPVDNDAFSTILSNPNCDAETMSLIFDYASDEYQHGDSMEFYNTLDDKMRLVVKNIANDIKNASNSDELMDATNVVNRLNSMYDINPKIYQLIAKSEHLTQDIIIKIMKEADSAVILSLIENSNLPNAVLNDIDTYANLHDAEVWKAVHNAWIRGIKEERIDVAEVADYCKDLDILTELVKSGQIKTGISGGIIAKILKGDYSDYDQSADECLFNIIKHIELTPRILFYIKERLPENYFIEDPYKIEKLISHVVSNMVENESLSKVRDIVYNYNIEDIGLTKKLLNAASERHSINIFHDLYVKHTDVDMLDKAFLKYITETDREISFNDVDYIYREGSPAVKEAIIKKTVLPVKELLNTEDDDDEYIKELKEKSLMKLAKTAGSPRSDVQLYDNILELPPAVFVAYAKRVNLADDMVNWVYMKTQNQEVRKAIDKNFSVYDDLNKSSKVNPSDLMKPLIAKGKEQGTITHDELIDTLLDIADLTGEEFTTEQRQDIFKMIEDMGIRIVG